MSEKEINQLKAELEEMNANREEIKAENSVKDDFPEIKRSYKSRGNRF